MTILSKQPTNTLTSILSLLDVKYTNKHANAYFNELSKEKISYLWHKKDLTIRIDDFFYIWSGTLLVEEADENSIESGYKQHRKEELATSIQKVLLLLAGIVLTGIALYENHILQNAGLFLLLILNLAGVYIGYLLVEKQINIHSNVADKICSLFSKSDIKHSL
ncbi:hypothetical protein AB9N12_03565 [Bacteroides sp. AN502(2024)]|uniref:hypothetical protein n=1 Tax=Bacteroides sp. AN502(2024) TaxID=3160599 RepID=UPI0035113BCD